jgi:hypothetical protein
LIVIFKKKSKVMVKKILHYLVVGTLLITSACKNTDLGPDNPTDGDGTAIVANPFDSEFLWINGFAGNITLNQKTGRNLVTDAQNNIYVLATYKGTVDANPGTGTANLTATGNSSLMLAKYTQSGQYAWAVSIPIDMADNTPSLNIDGSGNLYVASAFTGTIQIAPGVSLSAGSVGINPTPATVAVIAKYDNNGNYVSSIRYPNNDVQTDTDKGSSIMSTDIVTDASGNIYLGYNDITNKNSAAAQSPRHGIAKFSSAGVLAWKSAFGVGGTGNAGFRSDLNTMAIDKDGNLITSGNIFGYASYAPVGASRNFDIETSFNNYYVAKMEASSGRFYWVKTYSFGSGGHLNKAYSLLTGADGSIYLAGSRDKDAIPQSSPVGTVNANTQHLIYKLSTTNGDVVWRKTIDAQTENARNSLTMNAAGDLIASGTFNGQVNVGGASPLTGTAKNNVYMAKYKSDGSYVSSRSLKGKTANDNVTSSFIVADKNGKIDLLGGYNLSGGNNSIYLSQLADQ